MADELRTTVTLVAVFVLFLSTVYVVYGAEWIRPMGWNYTILGDSSGGLDGDYCADGVCNGTLRILGNVSLAQGMAMNGTIAMGFQRDIRNDIGIHANILREIGSSSVYGFHVTALHNTTSTVSYNTYGLNSFADKSGTGADIAVYGLVGGRYGGRQRGSGAVTNMRGISILNQILDATGDVTNAYSLYIEENADTAGGQFTNVYSIYAEDQNEATALNYQLYLGAGTNYLSGSLGLGDATPDAKLDVVGAAIIEDDLLVNDDIDATGYMKAGLHVKAVGDLETDDDIFIAKRHVTEVDAQTIADNTVPLIAATLTHNINTGYVTYTCNDADGCDITVGKTNAVAGMDTKIVCLSTNACNIYDSAGVTELNVLGGTWTGSTYDTLYLLYIADRYVELARSDN
jgi:hypothetical protein